jgi:hypothetical protein
LVVRCPKDAWGSQASDSAKLWMEGRDGTRALSPQ